MVVVYTCERNEVINACTWLRDPGCDCDDAEDTDAVPDNIPCNNAFWLLLLLLFELLFVVVLPFVFECKFCGCEEWVLLPFNVVKLWCPFIVDVPFKRDAPTTTGGGDGELPDGWWWYGGSSVVSTVTNEKINFIKKIVFKNFKESKCSMLFNSSKNTLFKGCHFFMK